MVEHWEVYIHREVKTAVYLLPKDFAQPIRNKMYELRQNPYPTGHRLIGGFENVYEVTVVNHTIVYQVLEELQAIRVLKVQLSNS